ncbi:MAG: hypothetical protein P1P86_00415 [Bacteroidales bacterium]|nr:hypothetical protein [Bacteroidales bacterium]
MGFDSNGVKLLLHARQLDVNFRKVLTIGRQMLFLNQKELNDMLLQAGLMDVYKRAPFPADSHAEPFLGLLGAEVTDSLDASAYEGATLIHDLNVSLPEELLSRYTLVIDGGSLEHVFNFPSAIKSCMNLIEKDGYYIGITPANNFLGHGFYQFSPELYYRIFSESNGFEIRKMYLYRDRKGASIYEVLDPLVLRQRVIMANSEASYLFVIAQKRKEKELFKIVAQQSDYEHIVWEGNAAGFPPSGEGRQPNSKTGKLMRQMVNLYNRHMRDMGDSNPQFVRKIQIDLSADK